MPSTTLTVALLLLTQTFPAQPPVTAAPEQPSSASLDSAGISGGEGVPDPEESPGMPPASPAFGREPAPPPRELPRQMLGAPGTEAAAPRAFSSQTGGGFVSGAEIPAMTITDGSGSSDTSRNGDPNASRVAPATRFAEPRFQGQDSVGGQAATSGQSAEANAVAGSSGRGTVGGVGMEASSGLAAAAQEPAAPAAPTAVAWLRDAWQQSSPPSEGEQAITLYDALRRGTLTARRGDAVAAYWKLCEHQLRLQTEQDLLARLMEVQPPEGSGAMLHWRAAYEQAQAEVRDAELKQLQAQLALQGFWPRGSGIRPRPGEMPFAGAYQTRIETLFPGDSAPASLRQLHQTLPLELAAVEAIARAVAAREQLAEAFAQSYSQGQSQLTGVLDTLARLRQQRVRLIEGIVGYNLHIAEYALAIGGTQGDATVASMLIPRPDIPATTSFERAELRPVAAFEPLQPVPGQAPAGQALIYREPATYPTPIPGASR